MIQDLTVVILTYNEESNIGELLDSIKDITSDIFVVDSYSNDKTISILEKNRINYLQHPFESYSKQRNWAQENEPFCNNWILHLDADELVTVELLQWLQNDFNNEKEEFDGFMFSRRIFFLGRWIKHGGQYPNYHLRLYKKQIGRCENKLYDQHFVLKEGDLKKIVNADICNIVAKDIDDLILSHNKWASFEARDIVAKSEYSDVVEPKMLGTPIERKRWLKNNVFQRSPHFLRGFMYFVYRYFFRLGFIDGKEGLIFHVLQGFWFRFLIDAKVYEIKQNSIDSKYCDTPK